MKAYKDYKAWWIEFQAPDHIPSLYWGNTPEKAFEQHIKNMNLYELMETLVDWSDDENQGP